MKKYLLHLVATLICIAMTAPVATGQRQRNYIYLFDCTQSMQTLGIWDAAKTKGEMFGKFDEYIKTRTNTSIYDAPHFAFMPQTLDSDNPDSLTLLTFNLIRLTDLI
ncbi:MAG: hypothetical protein K2F77_04390 [Muribaculaceae bacterium]|nr:hypothetical protein [Muribaculaceae bacterium]